MEDKGAKKEQPVTGKKDPIITRKDFLKRSSAGLLAAGFLTDITLAGQDRAGPSRSSEPVVADDVRPLCSLGKTGIEVTPVGFGAARTMEPVLLKSALDKGINFLDTGRSYFNGQNEVMVGKVVRGLRDRVVIQSKISLRLGRAGSDLDAPATADRIERMMQSSLEKSLVALKTDYVDIMLLHGASSVDLISHRAVTGFFERARKAGHIRACGFSSHTNQVELLRWLNKNPVYHVVMVPYNHKGSFVHSRSGHYSEWDQPALEVELKRAHSKGIGIVAMKTCSAGPYAFREEGAAGEEAEEDGAEPLEPRDRPKPTFGAALGWVLAHEHVHSTAVAMGNLDEIDENVQAMQ